MASLARCISQFEHTALQKKDWKAFARLYNGPAYAQNRPAFSSYQKLLQTYGLECNKETTLAEEYPTKFILD